MQPRRQRRIPPKPAQLGERPDERLLRELASEVPVPGEAKGQAEDPWRVRVIQLARGHPVSSDHPGDELGLAIHEALGFNGNCGTRHCGECSVR